MSPGGSMKIRVVVVDPHPIFRQGVVVTIDRCDDMKVVGEGGTAEDARQLARDQRPDILILDINMPEGDEAAREIAKLKDGCKLVVLTGVDDVMTVSTALAAGAHGYILKGVRGSELATALRRVHSGQPYVTLELASRLLVDSKGGPLQSATANLRSTLSHRQLQVLNGLSKGLTNREIAEQLGLKVSTVKFYLTQLFKIMNVPNRLRAIQAAQDSENSK
jgi:two-component system, NarL family, nitrate/nitrite response regulator NarL